MSEFQAYLKLGFDHISDLAGYDHILFVVALCAVYRISQWKNILVLVTAFTIGHSITLALSALNVVKFKPEIIEFLIPVTIFLTAMFNVLRKGEQRKFMLNYFLALFFGLIHGLGFSNYFKALLGAEENIVQPLFAFNIGVELGQLIIVAIILAVGYLVMNIFKAKQKDWNLFISGAAAGVALILMAEAKFW
jgi:ABC-type antimicrobial peptide transport system permease subunit